LRRRHAPLHGQRKH